MIYLCSPYSHTMPEVMHERYLAARRFTAHLMRRNFIVYSPIVYGHEMAREESLPTDFTYWRQVNDYMIECSVCVAVLQLPGWEASLGVAHEIEYAKRIGREVLHFDSATYKYLSGEEV